MTLPPAASDADYPALFALERQSLVAVLGSLRSEEWSLPTACPGWSVLDLTCHLLGDDLGLLARQRDGHAGLRPPPGRGDEESFARWLDGVQDAWVEATRRLSPRLAADMLAWTGPQVVALFRAQDPSASDAFVSWAGNQPLPRWLDHARELSEHWIHRQQLLEALGHPADLTTPVAAAVLDALRWAYPHSLGQLERSPGDTISIIAEGPVKLGWHLSSDGSAWTFVAEPGGSVIAELRLTTDQLWRLLTNNLRSADQAQLDAQGEQEVVEVLRRTRAVIGIPS